VNIEKWGGLVSAASPYALPPEAATEQHNLQIRKPGQLVPRPGLEFVRQGNTYAVVGLHRQSSGGAAADRLLSFCLTDIPVGSLGSYALQSLALQGNALQSSTVYTVTSTADLRPSFAQDRHGTVYTFFGNGVRPQTYRYSINTTATENFGLDAPTVAPQVSASGDGWFLERVDVLFSGTSYYAPPTLTVSGGGPTRNATLRAVVQAGQIIAVDVADGGSNFQAVPSIALSDEQVGTGFRGRGIRTVSAAIYGFRDTTAITSGYPTGSLNTSPIAFTHSFDLSTSTPTVAYKNASGGTSSVSATFDSITGTFTALVPLTDTASPANGVDAFAELRFNSLSSAAKLGNATVAYQTGVTERTTTAGTAIKFRAVQTNWNLGPSNDMTYYQNTSVASNDTKYVYDVSSNQDAFWGLMPNPGSYRFAKRQVSLRWWKSGDINTEGGYRNDWANYHMPDYRFVGYRLLIGSETGLANEANWEVGRSLVQRDGNGRPFIDITLKPTKKPDGSAYAAQPGTLYPKVRFFLKDCPATWEVTNTAPFVPSNNDDWWARRYQPFTGNDRRLLATDPNSPSSSAISGTMISYSLKNATTSQIAQMDTALRWWNVGHVPGNPMARPIVDFRTDSAGDTTGIGVNTVQVVNAADAGGLLERGTKFVVRFEQYNAAHSLLKDQNRDFGWITSISNTTEYPLDRTLAVADMPRNGAIGATFTDFYFEANVADTTTGGLSSLLPGAVTGTPKVTVTGRGWTAAGQFGQLTLRQRDPSVTPAVYSDSVTYRWTTVELLAASTAQKIGTVEILSAGQNYYREPTILFKDGGGYGLRVQSTVSGGRITSVVVTDGGDGFVGDCELYTDVQPAKLMPILRGTMRGVYRCAYRYADYRQTAVLATSITTTTGSKAATIASAVGVKPGMQITDATGVAHLCKITSISGNAVTLSHAATATGSVTCTIRDMTLPITYSDFSPITDIDASANGSGRASVLAWTLAGVVPPTRAQYVEFFRTSSDQSLVFYRLEQYGTVGNGVVTIRGTDGLSDEELFDIERPGYAALPVVLPNGGLNAFRFGVARSDMSVAVAWQDRLWYGVSTSGLDTNTVFFSEYDEFESCPDINEIPIQNNLRATDFLTALVPFGSVLLAMQSAHAYTVAFNTDPAVDAVVNLAAHRGVMSHRCWDIFDDALYAMDERGIYRMMKNGDTEALSDTIRDYFDEGRLDLSERHNFHLRIDQKTGILRAFVSLAGQAAEYPTIALCYHIENKAWWTEGWPTSLTASTDYRGPGRPNLPIYGALDGSLFEMAGVRDCTFRDIASVAVTNGGSGYTSAPTVTATGGVGAELRAIISDGQVTEVLVAKGGYGYGTASESLPGGFSSVVPLTFSGGGGTGAAATGTARNPNDGYANGLPIPIRTTIPWTMRTGPLALQYEGNARNGDGQIDRSITVTYRPCDASTILNLREYYNNSPTPRSNVMRRDRGTGFVHDTQGAKTTLDMAATRSARGLSTGLAKAQFAGRSMDDLSSADRHLAIELSADASAVATNDAVSQPLIYALEVRGVADGK
jgi:hypothetical protein